MLTPREVEDLWRILRTLRYQRSTILLITHKLEEVMAIADRVSVMRRGEMIGTVATKQTSPAELARMMVGRDVVLTVKKGPSQPRDVVLEVKDLVVPRPSGGTPAVNDAIIS